jgi:hypothetical protein
MNTSGIVQELPGHVKIFLSQYFLAIPMKEARSIAAL